MDARAGNDRVAAKAAQYHFISRVPMLCECSSPDCRQVVLLALADYREIRRDPENLLTAPGHEIEETELVVTTPNYEVRRDPHRSNGNGDSERRSA